MYPARIAAMLTLPLTLATELGVAANPTPNPPTAPAPNPPTAPAPTPPTAPAPTPPTAPAPMEVTSDTPEYCRQLFNRLHDLVQIAARPPPIAVADLSVAGQRMCEHGQVRGGIMRLRRALMLMLPGQDGTAR